MAEPDLQLLQTMVQRVLDNQADAKADLGEIKERLGLLEGTYASISRRVDRLGGEVEQIKRRLDIVDAPAG